jgi:hypothetical protein
MLIIASRRLQRLLLVLAERFGVLGGRRALSSFCILRENPLPLEPRHEELI